MTLMALLLASAVTQMPVPFIPLRDEPLVEDATNRYIGILHGRKDVIKDRVPQVIYLGPEVCVHFINRKPRVGGDVTFCYSAEDRKFTRQFLGE